MDDFEVRAKSADILSQSSLVDEMLAQTQNYTSFPVIINGLVRTFHAVRGGYVDDGDYHLVQLVQRHDNMAEEPREVEAAVYELHLNDSFLLFADDVLTFNDDAEFVLCLKVSEWNQTEHTFHEQLQDDEFSPREGYNWVDQ